jgi:hypothetical protein
MTTSTPNITIVNQSESNLTSAALNNAMPLAGALILFFSARYISKVSWMWSALIAVLFLLITLSIKSK